MRIHSDSFEQGQPIPPEFALGARAANGDVGFGGNRNPHLAWNGAPGGTRSFALLCIDADAPTDGALVANDKLDIPVEHPRGDFVHWVVANLPADTHEIAAGSCSNGVTPHGKGPCQGTGARQGVNDYTGWFAGDAAMGGDWYGYDGPYPPPHDARVHRYFFRVFALHIASLELPPKFTAADVFRAMHGHVLAEAATWGTYSLHA